MAALDGLAIAGREPRNELTTRLPRSSRGAMDWDDVRVFLAVAREGSMRAAGRALGLSQPTIARRLAAFEATFGGSSLFDRLPEGLRLNAAGEQLVPAAESVEDAVLTLERQRAAASPALSGTVRVSTGECAAAFLARPHPEQGFRACLGIVRLVRPSGADRLEAAATRAIEIGTLSYRSVRSILDNKLDRQTAQRSPVNGVPILHPNIRVPRYYH